MTLSTDDYATMHSSLAFTRAFIESDSDGANAMFTALPVDQLPGFVSGLATWVRTACELGGIPAGAFVQACAAEIDRRAESGGASG